MIEVHCKTNLDLRGEDWPEVLPCLPAVGHTIQSATKHNVDGRSVPFQLELEVTGIRWEFSDLSQRWKPYIELHMTKWQKMIPPKDTYDEKIETGSITAFYQWYAPLVGKDVGAFI